MTLYGPSGLCDCAARKKPFVSPQEFAAAELERMAKAIKRKRHAFGDDPDGDLEYAFNWACYWLKRRARKLRRMAR